MVAISFVKGVLLATLKGAGNHRWCCAEGQVAPPTAVLLLFRCLLKTIQHNVRPKALKNPQLCAETRLLKARASSKHTSAQKSL